VDEVWVHSRTSATPYVAAGVPADRVALVPLGVDPSGSGRASRHWTCRGRPAASGSSSSRHHLRGKGSTCSRAFAHEFGPGEPVTLVVKDMGTGTFYRGQTARAAVEGLRRRGADVVYLDEAVPESDLPALYRPATAWRTRTAEGFALRREAMACGRAGRVTAGGATDDYCDDATRLPGGRRPARAAGRRVDGFAGGRPVGAGARPRRAPRRPARGLPRPGGDAGKGLAAAEGSGRG